MASVGEGFDLHPHPERVPEEYAEARIREKMELYEGNDRARTGLANVNEGLKDAGVPAAYRLHFITAVSHLGRLSGEDLDKRVHRAATGGGLTAASRDRFREADDAVQE